MKKNIRISKISKKMLKEEEACDTARWAFARKFGRRKVKPSAVLRELSRMEKKKGYRLGGVENFLYSVGMITEKECDKIAYAWCDQTSEGNLDCIERTKGLIKILKKKGL